MVAIMFICDIVELDCDPLSKQWAFYCHTMGANLMHATLMLIIQNAIICQNLCVNHKLILSLKVYNILLNIYTLSLCYGTWHL